MSSIWWHAKIPSSAASVGEVASNSHFFIKGDKKIHQVPYEEILYIEAYGNYTKIYLLGEMIVSHEKISSLEKVLPSTDFLRVHKSFIVSIKKIRTIEGNRIAIGEHLIPIGQTYRNDLMRRIGKL